MSTKSELQALLERVKAATGPDRMIDAAVQHAVFPQQRVLLDPGKVFGPGEKRPPTYGVLSDIDILEWWGVADIEREGIAGLFEAPPYTASLDAITALIERELPGWWCDFRLGTIPPHLPKGRAVLWNSDRRTRESINGCVGDAATPALALIAAFLSAMIAQMGDEHDE